MKIRKTRQEERSVYRYPVNVADEKGGYRTEYITIRPGENGVTEADIKTLHSLDDSEVYAPAIRTVRRNMEGWNRKAL